MDEDHLPEKEWLVNVLYTINPDHKVFIYSKSKS